MAKLSIRSSAFEHQGAIPEKYSCQGDDISPPLEWSGVPESAQSLALIVDDPDAPDPAAPKRVWVHWVVYNLPPSEAGLPENVGKAPAGARDGVNDWGRKGYGGPCPPIGRHRYFHKLYALDTMLSDVGSGTKAELEKAMEGHILARGELIGTYQKAK
jgi:Raf kinase inhibitor-like YbhB/YbcL family protein